MVSALTPLAPIDASGAELGLICGYQLFEDRKPQQIPVHSLADALQETSAVTWLHFNLSDARVRRWLVGSEMLPKGFRETLHELDENRRIDSVDDGLILVISDFAYEDSDPAEVNSLWCYASSQRLITARLHALRSSDELRQRLRNDATSRSGVDLLAQLLDLRNLRLRQLATDMSAQLDRVEDEILAGNVKQQREYLGRTRRTCARLRRQFGPERMDFAKFLHRSPAAVDRADRDSLESSIDTLGFTVEEIAECYERAKLLQEELASRLAESTSRNLYTLSVLTAVLLPMTLVTGIFGMNVPDLPGVHGGGAFWHVMLLIVLSGAVTLAALIWRKLL